MHSLSLYIKLKIKMRCKRCYSPCIKNGFQANGKQRYKCKVCKQNQQSLYRYKAYLPEANMSIHILLVNSCGITDISRVLKISRNTVQKRILYIANKIKRPTIIEISESYEMDELSFKYRGKWLCIAYAINRKTRQVIDYTVGNKTNENLAKVINKLLLLNPKRIYTDGLVSYRSLIPNHVHGVARSQTNRIERFNLNLRTHLKRLNRKTICYTKSIKMLSAILKIYFWGNPLKYKTLDKAFFFCTLQ